MGKSPGKWIKTVLFGKKSSKSGFPKDRTVEKKASIASNAASGDLAVDSPEIPDLLCPNTDRSGENIEFEKGTTANVPCDAAVLLPGKQDADAEVMRQEQAATTAQAAFRGYLARRAFWALKGIIRLQALVRGHLVRRQAVATFRCMQAIVKLQAVVRGRRVRLSDIGCEVLKKYSLGEPQVTKQVDLFGVSTSFRSEKLLTNAYVTKLLTSSPTAMPLSLQYEPLQPNSVSNWLERWSSSRFWEPLARPKKIVDAKPRRKHANMQVVDTEAGRPKRGVKKLSTTNGVDRSVNSSEFEKAKRNPRKVSSNQAELVQEPPQNELERVKRNLKKVSASAAVAADESEAITEKPGLNLKKVSSSAIADVPDQRIDNSSEKMSDPPGRVYQQDVTETPPKPLVVDESLDVQDDNPPDEEMRSLENSAKVGNSPTENELSFKEDETSKENQRTRRRKSLPAKQEYPENVSQNTPTLPSYMAVTESAKAKLKAQGSLRSSEDGAESGFVRRNSLPSSTNGKISSLSPRIQKLVQANGKVGSRSDRSLLSSRDEKVLQPGWRR
ncbi:unnamed protein product [Ilex paraguariensis]|uniref:DUF4005 domain-containing protein n=1 Tax=Ilex paraguariensis TaxID=185542 RepID=A0ABC8UYJ9_9AQUA